MVWGLFAADPSAGDDKFYIFTKGFYKVGRRGCDIIINNDKAISRIHAEIIVDEMILSNTMELQDDKSSGVRIHDCSKYGTFISKKLGIKEKIHELPNKESTLKDGDAVLFGTGNARYRFCYVPFVFFIYLPKACQADRSLEERVSTIGACATYHISEDCTHAIVSQQLLTCNIDVIDIIIARKPIVLSSWVEVIAGKGIVPEIPSWSSFVPTLTMEGLSVKVADPRARASFLNGFIYLLESSEKYIFGDKFSSLLKACGSKIVSLEEFCSSSHGLGDGEENRVVHVIPRGGSTWKNNNSTKLSLLSRLNEVDLLCATISGHLDLSLLIQPSVIPSSSCSTEETIVADSDPEAETAVSRREVVDISSVDSPKFEYKAKTSIISRNTMGSSSIDNEPEIKDANLICSRHLIIEDSVAHSKNGGEVNFKRFKKTNILSSGNSFSNLIPFSKHPYRDSEGVDERRLMSMKEERRRRQAEAMAEDLFNNEKGRRRATGSIREFLTRDEEIVAPSSSFGHRAIWDRHMDKLTPNPANSAPLTPLIFLERAATVYGDCPSIKYNSIEYSWSETHSRCLRLASSLSSAGIRRGDVVSVLAPNVPAMYELQFAVPMAGAVINNINTRLDPHTISVILAHGESKLVFVDSLLRDLVLEARYLLPPPTNNLPLVLIADPDDGEPEGTADGCFCCTYESMVEKGDPLFSWVRPNCEWDKMALNYTSGTTSSPKGVVHCHRGFFNVTLTSLLDWSVPNGAVYLWTLPIFHSNGWSFPWGMAAVGGTNICIRKFDAGTIYEMIARHGVTHMCGAPVVLNMLTNSPGRGPLKNPVHIIAAGAPPPAAVLLGAEALGFLVSHGYGLTETAGVVVSCAWKSKWNRFPAEARARLRARQGVGVAGFIAMDVLDQSSGRSVNRDGISLGEVVLRGPSVMLGYLKDAEATSRCIKEDGWLYTGDVGVMHPDGYLEIKDRSKDVIISGGENISSIEVESILYTHPAVNEVAVVARPDEYWGETPCAFLSLKTELTGHVPDQKDVIEFCRDKMPHYMIPKTIVFKQDLPKTSTGKIQKFLLRDIAVTLISRSDPPSRL